MNCKQGDLAMIIGGKTQGGKVVTCLRLLSRDEHQVHDDEGPVWAVDRDCSFQTPRGSVWRRYCPDKVLMPINPSPDDETVKESDALTI